MRTTRLALTSIAIIIASGFYLLVAQLLRDSRTETYQATEETLVDTARLLAALLESTVQDERVDPGALHEALLSSKTRVFSAQIQSLVKERVDLHVYITDAKGIVIYDSAGKAEGQDYSKWNDVLLTLQGRYGARSSRLDPNDPRSSVMHISSPIYAGEKIIGVLTVVKQKSDQAPFLEDRRRKILQSGLLIGGGLLLFVGAVFFWLFRPMRQLADYAQSIGSGKRRTLPHLGHGREARSLARAIESMREELEGREYAGHYVRTLTHELKSPLAAIQGAAELLAEPMPEEHRQRFLGNIRHESQRAENLIRRLLRLSEVERLKALETNQTINVPDFMTKLQQEMEPLAASHSVRFQLHLPPADTIMTGTPELLHSALLNLLENAIDFSPPQGVVTFRCEPGPQFSIIDEGPGIPDYAEARLYERFYSLKHNLTGRKGTGLGLCYVKEVAHLHHAKTTLKNRADGQTGAVASFGWNDAVPY